jgi:hypothetical protein
MGKMRSFIKNYHEISRFLIEDRLGHLQYSPARLQPNPAKAVKPNFDVDKLGQILNGMP